MSDATKHAVLVAGIGNVFLGDDGFGVEVLRRLAQRPRNPRVRLMDAGIRGLDLAYALLEGWEAAVLIDAVCRGNAPGTLYVIDPQVDAKAGDEPPALEGHAMDPRAVLRFVQSQGAPLPKLRIVGCEPGPIDLDEIAEGLSEPVQGALQEAVRMVEALIAELEVPHA